MSKTTQIVLALTMPASVIIAYWLYSRWSSDEECYGEKKVVTTHNTKIRVKVPGKAVGTVIGKQGSMIKKIQAETGARLQFNDRQEDGGEARELMIIGTAQTATQAELMVYQIIAEVPQILKEEIRVPYFTVGRIIGKGGRIIRDIRLASGAARIDIDKFQGPSDGMKGVTVSGTRKQIDVAFELIEEIVNNAEVEREEKSNNSSRETYTPREKGFLKATAIPIEEDDNWNGESEEEAGLFAMINGVENDTSSISDFFQVMVSAVEHPGHFWVQMFGQQSLHLEQLQKEITRQLESEDVREELAVTEALPGDLVAAKFAEDDPVFYRAKVLEVAFDGKADLYFLDYGDNTLLDLEKIYKLRPEFHHFPHQAIECQLANVESLNETVGWEDEDITVFEDLVHCAQWKVLHAKTLTYTRIQGHSGEDEGQETLRPCLQLVDTNNEEDVDIGQELIRRGHARACSTTQNDHAQVL